VIVTGEMELLNGDDSFTKARKHDGSHKTNVKAHLQIIQRRKKLDHLH